MARFAVVILACLTLSGCASLEPPGMPEGVAEASPQATQASEADAPVASVAQDTHVPTWWILSVQAAPEGSVASFAWPIPADARSHEWPSLDLVPQAVGNVTAWTFMAAQDLGKGMEIGYPYGSWPSTWVKSSLSATRTSGDTAADFLPTRALAAVDKWEGHEAVWLLVTATGTGRLDLAFRVTDPVEINSPILAHEKSAADLLAEFAAAGPAADLKPAAIAIGAKLDYFIQGGSLANAPTLGYIGTSWTEGVAILGDPDLAAPAAQAGYVELTWSAPWAKWGQVSWLAHDNVGAMVIDYDMAAGGLTMTDTIVASGTYFSSFIDYPYASLAGDGPGAGMSLRCTMAAGGDYLVLWFKAMALGASLEELTGVPAAAVKHTPRLVGT